MGSGLIFTSCIMLDNLLSISKPQFPHLQRGDNSTSILADECCGVMIK